MAQNNTGPGRHPTSTPLMDHPDHAGGIMAGGDNGRAVPTHKGSDHKSSMIDGPYGGKKRQG